MIKSLGNYYEKTAKAGDSDYLASFTVRGKVTVADENGGPNIRIYRRGYGLKASDYRIVIKAAWPNHKVKGAFPRYHVEGMN